MNDAKPVDTRGHAPMPNPTEADLKDPRFEAVWRAIKDWDINVPTHYNGYCGGNGSHVMLILDKIRGVL